MPDFNSQFSPSGGVLLDTKPLAYCHGFMSGLNQTFDDELILTVLGTVFGSTSEQPTLDHSAASASVFMRGLYDGIQEYQRLLAEPVLHRRWGDFMVMVEALLADYSKLKAVA